MVDLDLWNISNLTTFDGWFDICISCKLQMMHVRMHPRMLNANLPSTNVSNQFVVPVNQYYKYILAYSQKCTDASLLKSLLPL